MKVNVLKMVAAIALGLALLTAAPAVNVVAQDSGQNGDKHVQILTDAVEFVSYSKTAEQCKSKKGETIKVRVKSESPMDVRLYIAQARGKWYPLDFPNQQPGAEVMHYQCDRTPVYKVFARPAGSTGAWAKP